MAMVLKATKKYKVLKLITDLGYSDITKSYDEIKESAAPKEVPLNGFDTFDAPSMEGKWEYDSTLPELRFSGGSASTKVYKIVKTKV